MKKIFVIIAFLASAMQITAKETKTLSPDGKLCALLKSGEHYSIELTYEGKSFMKIEDIYMKLFEGTIPASGAKVVSATTKNVNNTIVPLIRERNSAISDRYCETIYKLSDRSSIVVRVYDNGAAYRIGSDKEGEITILDEPARFIVDTVSKLIWQKATYNSCEFPYVETSIESAAKGEFAPIPALVKFPDGKDLVFLQSDVQDYPVLWIEKDEDCLKTRFWNYPDTYKGGTNYYEMKNIATYKPYIAKTSAKRNFPWRVFALATEDKELLANELVYQLAPECMITDPSWIKPGWVMFDWWGKYGVYGVDFKAGMNTPTAKYMIDFASQNGIRYFLFDDGWTVNNDLTCCKDDLDIKEVTDYAAKKGVDVMLWVTFDLLDDQMEKALKQFEKWGVKGIKIDFMDRDDQEIVNFYWRAAKAAAEHKMVIDFHGAYCPDGLRRAYPNVLTREALLEFEMNGGGNDENPRHHCLLPFLRCVSGPADYIPGTMNNSSKGFFRHNGWTPMGQGTRTHAMSMAVVVESPMQMLPDGPTDYLKEPECTSFLTSIPVEWDSTVPLDCKIGEYVSLARKSGDNWYVAAITNWDKRDMKINLGFLEKGGRYKMEIFRDGINADLRAEDYKHEFCIVEGGSEIEIHMASGGGWLAKITKL